MHSTNFSSEDGVYMSMFDKNISQAKKDSLEFAEDQRQEGWSLPSFSLGIYHGKVNWPLIYPFPRQSAEEKKIGDEYINKFRTFLKENLDPDEVDRTGIIPDHVMKGLAKFGGFAMKVPKKYGGLGLSQVNYNRVMHMISSYCGSTAVLLSAHQSIGVPQPLKEFGTEEQKQKYFPRFAKGEVSAFALTEPSVGSDPRNMTTTATLTEDGEHYLINGEKLWCTNGLVASVVVVMAVTPSKIVKGKERKQITAFIVEMDSPGIEILHRCKFMGLNGIQNGLIKFTDVKVPKENIILKEGEGLRLALTTLNTGRLTLPAASVGISKWCLYVAREWSKEREQWGGPIGEHESIGLKIAKIASHTFAMDAMTWLVSAMADNKDNDIRLEAAISKYFCTHHSWWIVDETLQIRGGQGYENAESLRGRGQRPWPVERVLRDVRINLIIEGTSEIMYLFIAREALDPHLSRMKPLLMKGGIGAKLGAAIKMAGYYAMWYPSLYLPRYGSFSGLHPTLKSHMRYVQTSSRRLARLIFHNMMKHQKKMESKQSVINRLVQIGVDLFSMTTTCSYAQSLLDNDQRDNALQLADLYCKHARERIDLAFRSSSKNCDKEAIALTKNILNNEFEWMEEEIVK